jgi:CheY-like chemotaxis protein
VNGSDWVLVVDDDADIREMIVLVLGLNGYQVIGAADGLAALDEIRGRGRPAGVLLDLRMPRMNGADFARALRQDAGLAAVPIVVLSGDVHAFEGEGVPEAAAFIKKPCDMERLLDEVQKWFLPRSNPTRQPPPEDLC